MSDRLDQATGVVTIALGWLTVALSPNDALAWGETLTQLAPFGLIAFLIWRLRQIDRQLLDCRKSHTRTSEQLLIAFMALKNPEVNKVLPEAGELVRDSCDLEGCIRDIKKQLNLD